MGVYGRWCRALLRLCNLCNEGVGRVRSREWDVRGRAGRWEDRREGVARRALRRSRLESTSMARGGRGGTDGCSVELQWGLRDCGAGARFGQSRFRVGSATARSVGKGSIDRRADALGAASAHANRSALVRRDATLDLASGSSPFSSIASVRCASIRCAASASLPWPLSPAGMPDSAGRLWLWHWFWSHFFWTHFFWRHFFWRHCPVASCVRSVPWRHARNASYVRRLRTVEPRFRHVKPRRRSPRPSAPSGRRGRHPGETIRIDLHHTRCTAPWRCRSERSVRRREQGPG